MKFELFIAQRIIKNHNKSALSNIIRLAIIAIALGLSVMIISIAVVVGFKEEVRAKVIGFGSHIIIESHGTNSSYETRPIIKNQSFYPSLSKEKGIKGIQVFATKAGIMKTDSAIQGIVLKGVDKDYSWDFIEKRLIDGNVLNISEDKRINDVVISKKVAQILNLKTGDFIPTYFIQKPPKVRKFRVAGIYHTGFEDYDKIFVFADIKHIQRLNAWSKNQVSGFEVLIDNFNELDEMEKFVFSQAGNKFLEDGTKMRVKTIKEVNPQIFDWLELTDMNVQIIIILMLLVAGINMISGLLIIILERTNMIGILKALGANNKKIINIFLHNAFFLILRGIFWGNLIGIGISLIQYYFKIIPLDTAVYYISSVPISLHVSHLILLNAGTVFVIFTMMLLPVLLIIKIKPVKAIKFN